MTDEQATEQREQAAEQREQVEGLLARLPLEVRPLLRAVEPPPRLVAHLALVHTVAETLVDRMEVAWPDLTFDRRAVLIGAATHDIGKALYLHELSGPGRRHEEEGERLLVANGLPAPYARFARTHGQWSSGEVSLEDMLVALADHIWRGGRNSYLEARLTTWIAELRREEQWQTFITLDDIVDEIARDAPVRLAWLARFTRDGDADTNGNAET